MTTNCGTDLYTINYTDTTKNPIIVNKKTLIQNIVDITLLGKARLEYGEAFDENILHLLENFASPELANNPGNPDLSQIYSNLLEQPTTGQLWFNTTQSKIFFYDGNRWNPISNGSDIAGNSGIIAHGQQLPLPISSYTGYEFKISECSWIVSPFNFSEEINYMACYTDSNANVTAQYRGANSSTVTSGYALYQIIGIKNNNNHGKELPVTVPILSPTPMPIISPTPSPIIGISATPTPTAPITPSATPIVSHTPAPSQSQFPSPTPSLTPSTSIPRLTGILYITPSSGLPNGSATSLPSSCTTHANGDSSCFFTLGLVARISGGTPPYTVNFGNVTYTGNIVNTSSGVSPIVSITYSYVGGSGSSTSWIRTGVTNTTSVQMNGQIGEFDYNLGCSSSGNWSITINNGSYVSITDSNNQTLNLYTPSGSNGNVYGTTNTSPQGNYIDSWYSTPACGGGGGGCVTVNSVLPDGSLAGDINVDDFMITSDPYNYFDSEQGKVTYAETFEQPCVRIVTESNASLICSITAPIPTFDDGYILAPDLLNKKVAVLSNNITTWENVVNVEPMGILPVRHITVGNRCFWAGETYNAYILHHNLKPKVPNNNYTNNEEEEQ